MWNQNWGSSAPAKFSFMEAVTIVLVIGVAAAATRKLIGSVKSDVQIRSANGTFRAFQSA